MAAKSANGLAIWRMVQIAIAIAAVILVGFLIWLPNNGSLVDLTSTMPGWFVFALQAATLSFFTGFMLLRKPSTSWSIRPAYSDLALAKK